MPSSIEELREGKKKKHVRFAHMRDEDNAEQLLEDEEDTLFDKHKDIKRGLKSAMKGGKSVSRPEEVEIEAVDGGRCGRWMVSLTLCASFLGLGMCISVLGPTLEDLAANVNKNISNISYIFAGRATGYIGGSLIGGILFDLINPHLLLGFSMLMTAFGMFAIPFCKKALILAVLISSVGVSMGILDTGGNVLILNTWADKAGPHMQALHFTFAAGAFFSPIIAKLMFGHKTNVNESSLKMSANVATAKLPYFVLTSMWAYIFIGTFLLLVSFFFFMLYSRSSSSSQSSSGAQEKQQFSKRHMVLISLLSLFFFFYVGAEVAYGSFIFTYAKDHVRMDEPHAAMLNSLFWGTFAACRGAAIFFATCAYPGTIILFCLVGTIISTTCLVLFNQHQEVLWTCTALYGASMAATFPTGISWVEQYTTITGKTAAAFVIGAALGEMVLPATLGCVMGRFPHAPLLMYMSLGTAIFTSILFPLMYKIALPAGGALVWKRRIKVRGEADNGEDRQALLDSIADDNVEEVEPKEDDSEAEQWNDADFEVIEMEDASLNSPIKISSPPPDQTSSLNPGVDVTTCTPVLIQSPRRKFLLDREKND